MRFSFCFCLLTLSKILALPLADMCQLFLKRCLTFERLFFRVKIAIVQSIKGKELPPSTHFSHFLLILFFFEPKSQNFSQAQKTIGVKFNLRSSFLKIMDPSTPKFNRPLLGGEENPSTKEQWIIPPFFEDYMFDKSFDWEFVPCYVGPPYTACEELDDLLTKDLELKCIPRLETCRGDFAPTIDVIFKSHTSISKD